MGVSSQCITLELSKNLFTGPLPSNIGGLKHLTKLSISNNQFRGEIPVTLGDCSMLEEIYMQGNVFEGRIPSSFKALKSLVRLDLSNNNMSRNIPSFLGEFHLMQNVNLSYNNLEGEVPTAGMFSNVSAFSVVENLQLCGGIHALKLPSCPAKASSTKRKQFPLKLIPLLVLLPLAILLACLALFFYRWRSFRLEKLP